MLWAFGPQSVLPVRTRCGVPLPTSSLADATHRRGLPERVSLPTSVRGRVIWHLGDRASQSAAACTESYGGWQRAAREPEPSYQVRGALTDGVDSTVSSIRPRCPGARLGCCRRHALNTLPDKLSGVSASVRQGRRSQCHALRPRCRPRQSLRVGAWGQRRRHCAERIATTVGAAPGERVRHGCQAKNTGW